MAVYDDTSLYAQVSETPIACVLVVVSPAEGTKCERCWKQSPAVGADAAHPTLCPRCAAVVAKLPQF